MSRGLLLTVWLTCVGCACVPAPSLAAANASDVAATQAYLRASDSYVLEESAGLSGRVVVLEARAGEIAGECPSALTYAPRDEAFGELGEEIVAGVVYASAAPERSLLLRFSREIGHLRWGNSKLTRLVRLRAAEESGVATVALPDVCADIVAWRASAYAELPQDASGFLARSAAIEAESFVGFSEESREMAILRLLTPYESLSERRIAARVKRLEAQFVRRISSAVSTAKAKLGAALGASVL